MQQPVPQHATLATCPAALAPNIDICKHAPHLDAKLLMQMASTVVQVAAHICIHITLARHLCHHKAAPTCCMLIQTDAGINSAGKNCIPSGR